MQTIIRPLLSQELPAASTLVQRVFDQFEAPDYPAEGIATFHRFTTPEAMHKRLQNNAMQIWGAFRDEQLLGVLATRDGTHISLLFVETAFHRQGIARMLFDAFRSTCRIDSPHRPITVNSSPYAVGIYLRLGFAATDCECLRDGIRFTPMEYLPTVK